MLRLLKIRSRPFYNTRHTYVSYMLELGAKPLWVSRQTGTSPERIENHYGRAKVVAQELDSFISNATERATKARDTALRNRSLPGTFDVNKQDAAHAQKEALDESRASVRAGDRGRTGEVQLGKPSPRDPENSA